MTLLVATNLSKSYVIGDRTMTVVRDCSLTIQKGEFVAIVGASGSGKTTLMSLLAGLDRPSTGSVLLNDVNITALDENKLSEIRTHSIGFIFQSFHLIPSLTALENVSFPLELAKHSNPIHQATTLLNRVGLGHRLNNFPSQLSGGEQQRVAICRSLANNPSVLFADEPTGNLDTTNSKQILQLLLDIRKEFHTAIVLVTHDPNIAAAADRSIRIVDGSITPPVETPRTQPVASAHDTV